MNKALTLLLVFAFWSLNYLYLFADDIQFNPVESKGLFVEIKTQNKGPVVVDKKSRKNFQFILKAGKKISVFAGHNEWNYFTRSFTAKDKTKNKTKYNIFRTQKGWDSNYPITQELNPGGSLITEIDFTDGTWTIDPPLPEGKDIHFLLRGHYYVENPKNDSVVMDDIRMKSIVMPWYGHLDTNPIEMTIKKNAISCFQTRLLDFSTFKTPYKNRK